MGYTTRFEGKLRFTKPIDISQYRDLQEILGQDCRAHPEWGARGLYHIDLRVTDEYDGLEHDDSEKTYDMPELVNVVIREMRKKTPDFGLTGEMRAQGEEVGDVWVLRIGDDGFAYKREAEVLAGDEVECPDCGHVFRVGAE